MKNVQLILIVFLLIVTNTFAQEKGIYLVNKKSKDSIFIAENLRVKIITVDGKRIVSVFKIADDSTILINGYTISMQEIAELRQSSIFHAIADPVAVAFGSILLFGGVTILLEGGWLSGIGTLFIIPGLSMTVLPIIKNNHKSSRWEYFIKNQNL